MRNAREQQEFKQRKLLTSLDLRIDQARLRGASLAAALWGISLVAVARFERAFLGYEPSELPFLYTAPKHYYNSAACKRKAPSNRGSPAKKGINVSYLLVLILSERAAMRGGRRIQGRLQRNIERVGDGAGREGDGQDTRSARH